MRPKSAIIWNTVLISAILVRFGLSIDQAGAKMPDNKPIKTLFSGGIVNPQDERIDKAFHRIAGVLEDYAYEERLAILVVSVRCAVEEARIYMEEQERLTKEESEGAIRLFLYDTFEELKWST